MQPYTKRMFAYFGIAIIAEYFVDGGIILAPALIFIDMTIDIVKHQYSEYKKDQKEMLDAFKDDR